MSQAVERALTRVLIVEDDRQYASLLSELLIQISADLRVSRVTTLDDACRRAEAESIDVVLRGEPA